MASSLILGANTILSTQIAAGLLASTQQRITWVLEDVDSRIVDEVMSVVEESLSSISGDRDPELKNSWIERFQLVRRLESNITAEEVWLFGGTNKPGLTEKNGEADYLRRSLSLLATVEVNVLYYVGSLYDCSRENPAQDDIVLRLSDEERLVSSFCAEHGIRARFFLTSWLVGPRCVVYDSGQGIYRLLHALDKVIAEIQERSPEYFDFQALRIYVPENATVNLVNMHEAAQLMLQIVAVNEISNTPCCIVSAEETSWTDFCELLGETYELSVLSVHNQEDLNAIDHLLCHQWGENQVAQAEHVARYHEKSLPTELQIDRETLVAFLSSIHKQQLKARVARDERIAVLPGTMQKRTIPTDGSDLTYYVVGVQGEYIVLINALGQPLDYWYRLIDVLMQRYRIIIWETRGLTSGSELLRLSDQADDLEAIVREEKIGSCHLVGWCNGPQIAIEFYLRQPDPILDMVFLSCGFGVTGHPELETPYNRNIETLCRAMIANPALTSSIQRSLSIPLASEASQGDGDGDGKAWAVQVLSLPNVHLRNCVLAPFRTETSTFNYAQQIVDLASYHTLDHAARVRVPVLIIGCEYDQVAAAAKSKLVAGLLPTSRHVELPGATHYSFYDRSEQIAGMMELFFKESQAIVPHKDAAVGVGQ